MFLCSLVCIRYLKAHYKVKKFVNFSRNLSFQCLWRFDYLTVNRTAEYHCVTGLARVATFNGELSILHVNGSFSAIPEGMDQSSYI